jgi:predicted metal-dependent phosphoesterase TrpH
MDIFNKKIVFHIHTKYSFDSELEPALIVDTLFKENISIAIITDHNSIRGAIEAKSYAEKKYGDKFNVIVGEEVKTDIGDIIGFPLKEEIQLVDHLEVISNIKRQGGYVCLPHPYKSHNLLRIHDHDFIEFMDFIEIFNGRTSEKLNTYAYELAVKFKKKVIIGSDIHVKKELLNTYFKFNENMDIIESDKKYIKKRTYRMHQLDQNLRKKKLKESAEYAFLAIINK